MYARYALLAAAGLGLAIFGSAAQAPKPAGGGSAANQQEIRPVLIDTIVTDKKGDFVRDLAPAEFHVFEDSKEQVIRSVSRIPSPASNTSPPTHLVLFFGRIPIADQQFAREAAVKFIETNAAPNRQIAILNYLRGGGAKVIQGFTSNPELLVTAAKSTEASGVLSSESGPPVTGEMSANYSDPDRTGSSAAFDVRSHLLALTSLARSLAPLPGRKAVVALAPTINYGMQARTDPGSVGARIQGNAVNPPAPPEVVYYVHPEDLSSAIDVCNKAKVSIYLIDVRVDHTPVENQLAPLAAATGGLSIDNSRDALNALQKIAQDQEERYVIEYVPSKSADGGCRKVRVKVDRSGTNLRARSEYCDIDANDPLAGTQVARDFEARAAGSQNGNMPARMQSAFFYTAADTARVHVTAEISTAALKFTKVSGKLHATLDVLGFASDRGGAIRARFSDAVEFNIPGKKEEEQFKQQPYRYEHDFPVRAGNYDLKLVFGQERENFGKVEAPLVIEPWDGKQFALSGVVLSKESRNPAGGQPAEALFVSEHVPLVSRGLQFVSSGNNRYKKNDLAFVYFEIYEPLLRNPDPPKVMVQLVIIDVKSKTVRIDSGRLGVSDRILAGNPVVPVGLKVPIDTLEPGTYSLVLKASDSAGNASGLRHIEIEVE